MMIGFESNAGAFLHLIIAVFGGICGGLLYDCLKDGSTGNNDDD